MQGPLRWTAPHEASRCRRVIVDDGRDRNRPRLAVGKGFPFPLFRLRNGFTVSPWRTFAEACGSAHYWAREIAKLGHTVKLMPPKYVKAYVKRGKTDAGDAAAICEAVARPSMSFVPVKGIEQQGLSMLHGARSQLIGQRTQLINAVRGHLSELGIVAARGLL